MALHRLFSSRFVGGKIVSALGSIYLGAGPLHGPSWSKASARRMMAPSMGKMPTTSVRRLISPLSCLISHLSRLIAAVFLGELTVSSPAQPPARPSGKTTRCPA